VQVPAATNTTTPDEALIVHTGVVELEYCFVPAPAEAVDVIVGGVASPEYEDEYEPASMVNVREVAVIVNVRVFEFAAAYPRCATTDAVIEQLPASTKSTAPVEELTVQTVVVELE
jgi:hypothetical protein